MHIAQKIWYHGIEIDCNIPKWTSNHVEHMNICSYINGKHHKIAKKLQTTVS